MKILFEPGDVVALRQSELNSADLIGEKFIFVSYLETPFKSAKKSNAVILDSVVYYHKWHILMPAKSQNLTLIKNGEGVFDSESQ